MLKKAFFKKKKEKSKLPQGKKVFYTLPLTIHLLDLFVFSMLSSFSSSSSSDAYVDVDAVFPF